MIDEVVLKLLAQNKSKKDFNLCSNILSIVFQFYSNSTEGHWYSENQSNSKKDSEKMKPEKFYNTFLEDE